MRAAATLLAVLLVSGISASARQATAPSLLDRLVGHWVLTGTIDGKPTTHDVDAEWVLNREYVRLHEVSRERDARGGPAYEAIVFIEASARSGEYTCLWLDSTEGGGLSSNVLARGKPTADSIPFVFKMPGGDTFYNTFVYSAPRDTWQWIMDGESGGTRQPFARLTLVRK